jgi:hypothetical protein
VKRVVGVDKGLHQGTISQGCNRMHWATKGGTYHSQRPDGVVEEDDRGGHQHGETNEFVKL